MNERMISKGLKVSSLPDTHFLPHSNCSHATIFLSQLYRLVGNDGSVSVHYIQPFFSPQNAFVSWKAGARCLWVFRMTLCKTYNSVDCEFNFIRQ